MHRLSSMFLLLLIPALLFAQQKDKRLTFKLKSQKATYAVFPADTVIWVERPLQVKLRIAGDRKKNLQVHLHNGTISLKDSIYTLQVNTGKKALLNVYEKQPGGKNKIVFSKTYHIMRIPDPVVYVCGVKSDSAISISQILREDAVWAYSAYFKKKLPVLAFGLVLPNDGSFDTLYSSSNHFSLPMRHKLNIVAPGAVLNFFNVRCRMPDLKQKVLKPAQIFIVEKPVGIQSTRGARNNGYFHAGWSDRVQRSNSEEY